MTQEFNQVNPNWVQSHELSGVQQPSIGEQVMQGNMPEPEVTVTPMRKTPTELGSQEELLNPIVTPEEDELVPPSEVLEQQSDENEALEEKPKSKVKLENFQLVNKAVTLQEEIYSPYVKDEKHPQTPVYFTPTTNSELEQIGESDYFSRDAESLPAEYRDAIGYGVDILQSNDTVLKAVAENPNADFRQYIEKDDGTPIKPFRPKWKNPGSNQALSGLKAIDKIRTALNQGSTITIPLWASGIWLTIKAPTTIELADNFDLIQNEIIELGKQTAGGIFENTQVYLNKNLLDLVNRLFYSWTLKDSDAQDNRSISEVILVDDLETIAWAISVCMYPNGYPFSEPCVSNIDTCNHISEQLINLSKIFWVDYNKLTKWQIEFMSNPTTKRSWDEIQKYRSEAKWSATSKVRLKDYPFTIYLKTPTAQEYIDSGYSWIESLKDSVRDIIPNANDNKLNSMIFERAGLTISRGYAHYVKAIVFDDGSRTNDTNDIEQSINEICAVPEAVTELVEKINEHITNSTVTMTALPRHVCPVCQSDPNADDKRHPYLIPISALKVFFSLRDRKLQLG